MQGWPDSDDVVHIKQMHHTPSKEGAVGVNIVLTDDELP